MTEARCAISVVPSAPSSAALEISLMEVAGEIGDLADQSRQTVMKIQEVTQEVTKAVDNLSANARKLLDFVVKDVTADYEGFLAIGEQYDKDGSSVDELSSSFKSVLSIL